MTAATVAPVGRGQVNDRLVCSHIFAIQHSNRLDSDLMDLTHQPIKSTLLVWWFSIFPFRIGTGIWLADVAPDRGAG